MWECGWAALDIIQVLMGLSRGHIPLPDHSDDENEDETGCGTIDDIVWRMMIISHLWNAFGRNSSVAIHLQCIKSYIGLQLGYPCMNLYANDDCVRIIMFEELCRSEIQRQGKDLIQNNN